MESSIKRTSFLAIGATPVTTGFIPAGKLSAMPMNNLSTRMLKGGSLTSLAFEGD